MKKKVLDRTIFILKILKVFYISLKNTSMRGFNKRYRLKTLGFDPIRISLEKVKENRRLKDLQKLKSNKGKNQEFER